MENRINPIAETKTKYYQARIIRSVAGFVVIAGLAAGIFLWQFKLVNNGSTVKTNNAGNQNVSHDLGQDFSVIETDAAYKAVSGRIGGVFKADMKADLLLSGIDFNNTGGPLLFNHPGNVASDGKHLILADRNNNRILIWNSLPTGNTLPDLVLGQKDFTANNPGTRLDNLNWPVGVAADGTHLLVADTYNDRILVWNSFPTQNGQPADLVLANPDNSRTMDDNGKAISWPWAVWSNGRKVVVASTGNGRVYIWNSFPVRSNQPPDLNLLLKGKFGTPRSIGSDGNHLMIGDHNAYGSQQGNFFWTSFPATNNQEPDFYMSSMENINQAPNNSGSRPGDVFWNPVFTAEGKFIALSGNSQIGIWNTFPQSASDAADAVIGNSGAPNATGYSFNGGDGSGLALAGSKLYVSLANGNKTVGFNSLLLNQNSQPNFAVGAESINSNTLADNFIISNPVPVSNGQSLFVSSDFDRKLYVWKNLPDESNAHPDLVYSLPEGPWDNALYNDNLVLASQQSVYIWQKLPVEPAAPDIILKNQIGNVSLQNVRGVALDNQYFYLADETAQKIYVWEGIPSTDDNPKFTLAAPGVDRLDSDGTYLVATLSAAVAGGDVRIYRIKDLNNNDQGISLKQALRFNLPQSATIGHNMLFVADTGFERLIIWNDIEKALNGQAPDLIYGYQNAEADVDAVKPAIGQDKLFWPSNPCFDGKYLWLGEFKFSERLLRFSSTP